VPSCRLAQLVAGDGTPLLLRVCKRAKTLFGTKKWPFDRCMKIGQPMIKKLLEFATELSFRPIADEPHGFFSIPY
jgi:hypothetical protein